MDLILAYILYPKFILFMGTAESELEDSLQKVLQKLDQWIGKPKNIHEFEEDEDVESILQYLARQKIKSYSPSELKLIQQTALLNQYLKNRKKPMWLQSRQPNRCKSAVDLSSVLI